MLFTAHIHCRRHKKKPCWIPNHPPYNNRMKQMKSLPLHFPFCFLPGGLFPWNKVHLSKCLPDLCDWDTLPSPGPQVSHLYNEQAGLRPASPRSWFCSVGHLVALRRWSKVAKTVASPLLQPHPKKNQQPFHTFLKLNSCVPRAGSKTQVILPSLLKGLHTCPFVCSSSLGAGQHGSYPYFLPQWSETQRSYVTAWDCG